MDWSNGSKVQVNLIQYTPAELHAEIFRIAILVARDFIGQAEGSIW